LFKEKVNEGINRLFNYIKVNPGHRVTHFKEQLEIPAKTIERWIKELKDDGKVEYRGSKKTGGYFPID
jgi:ATP-dependent DNA helicase RecG